MRIQDLISFVLTVVLQMCSQVHFKLCGDTYNRKKKLFILDLIFMALGKLKHLGKNTTVHKNHVISGEKMQHLISHSKVWLQQLLQINHIQLEPLEEERF